VKLRFEREHHAGVGTTIANFYWDHSWLGVLVGILLSAGLFMAWKKRKPTLYDFIFYAGFTLLILWFGFAMVAMETSFIGWDDLRGTNF
jgi:LPXTG-motif cell wall-anchored protein